MSIERIHELVEASKNLEAIKEEGFETRFEEYRAASDEWSVIRAKALRIGIPDEVVDFAKEAGILLVKMLTGKL